MKKVYYILNISLFLITMALGICYIVLGGLAFKGTASACFVLMGIFNLIYAIKNKNGKIKFSIMMLVGLTFAMLGDILLNIEFIVGAVLFAIAHVCYFVAYCMLSKFKWTDLIAGAIIFLPSVLFITLAPIFDFGGVLMEIVCVIYALIISCMVGKSISNLIRERNILNILLVVGSCLFFFSDLMLLLNVFGSLPKIFDILCLATYYPAECVLAYSISQTKKEQIEEK